MWWTLKKDSLKKDGVMRYFFLYFLLLMRILLKVFFPSQPVVDADPKHVQAYWRHMCTHVHMCTLTHIKKNTGMDTQTHTNWRAKSSPIDFILDERKSKDLNEKVKGYPPQLNDRIPFLPLLWIFCKSDENINGNNFFLFVFKFCQIENNILSKFLLIIMDKLYFEIGLD